MKTTRQPGFKSLYLAMALVGGVMLAGCGESDTTTTGTTTDTREVKTQPEAVAPSLGQRVESGVATLKQETAQAVEQVKQETAQVVEQVKQETQAVSDKVVSETKSVVETVKETVAPAKVDGQAAYASCVGCHGATGGGGVGPELKGKARDDLIAKLKAYRAGEQVGPMTAMMAPMALGLSDADIDALADYIVTF
ncbi:MAG: c-type cytochrome [Thiomicrospira sp.]|jgi:cytochrome c553|nr:c-type cytochrome [Thiomicrospira sp.]